MKCGTLHNLSLYMAPAVKCALCVQVAGTTAHEHNAVLLSPWIFPLVEFQVQNKNKTLFWFKNILKCFFGSFGQMEIKLFN